MIFTSIILFEILISYYFGLIFFLGANIVGLLGVDKSCITTFGVGTFGAIYMNTLIVNYLLDHPMVSENPINMKIYLLLAVFLLPEKSAFRLQ